MKTLVMALAAAAALIPISSQSAQEDKAPEAARQTEDPSSSEFEIRTQVSMTHVEPGRSVNFELAPDGKVELTVTEQDAAGESVERTYAAQSLEEFERAYPELTEEYGLKRMVPAVHWDRRLGLDDPSDWFQWKDRFDRHWFWDRDPQADRPGTGRLPAWRGGELDDWFRQQRHLFDRFRSLRPPLDQAGERLGVFVELVSEPLAWHLELPRGEGLLVVEVEPRSLASRAGLQRHDVIRKLDGVVVGDPGAFRSDVQAKLEAGFRLDVIRRGKTQSIVVERSPL